MNTHTHTGTKTGLDRCSSYGSTVYVACNVALCHAYTEIISSQPEHAKAEARNIILLLGFIPIWTTKFCERSMQLPYSIERKGISQSMVITYISTYTYSFPSPNFQQKNSIECDTENTGDYNFRHIRHTNPKYSDSLSYYAV